MTDVRHEQLHAALLSMLEKLKAGDLEGAGRDAEPLAALFQSTLNVLGDPRILELFLACQRAADEIHVALGGELKGAGASTKATSAYAAATTAKGDRN
jgi:hypothetical protein